MKTVRHAEPTAGEEFFFFLKLQNTTQKQVAACAQLSLFMLQIPTVCTHLKLLGAQVSILLSGHSGSFSG